MQTTKTRGRAGAGSPAKLRDLPGVSKLLAGRPLAQVLKRFGRELVTPILREVLEELRAAIQDGSLSTTGGRAALGASSIAREVGRRIEALLAPRPRVVLNATGVVVHTNLGRSTLSTEAAAAVARAAQGYVDLEFDLDRGGRGSRLDHLRPLMERLFPGHAFVVVNNNAAATMLCLTALAQRKEVVISRGELVEIGGSFRVPDILTAAGAKLREVGTTNRTRVGDYQAAIGKRTAMILKVHTSNFRVVGFTEAVTVQSLARLARRTGLPLVVDWGSGDLVDLGPFGIDDEVPALDVLQAGADLVTFSGDKLLGGPQAGFVVGRVDLIDRLRRHALYRAFRLDRLLIAALQRTLAAYVAGEAFEAVPTLRMLILSMQAIESRARRVVREIVRETGAKERLSLVDGTSRPGGGTSPAGERPTKLLAIAGSDGDARGLERALRGADPPLIGRMQDRKLLLDLRTISPRDDTRVARLVATAISAGH